MPKAPARAIVVGAGIGGTAATLLLARHGIDTLLVDKNPRIGGSCSWYEKRGFHLDIGTHMFCRGDKGPLGEVLRRAGHPGAIRFVRTRDIAEMRSVGDDGSLYKIAVPAATHRLPRFALEVARILELSPREALSIGRLFAHILAMSDEEVARYDHMTVEEFLEPFLDHDAILAMFSFLLGLFFVLPYWEVSAGEALWCFRRLVLDNNLSYPIGGSVAIPETYTRLAQKHGARVRTNAGVKKILVDDGRVRGVVLDNDEEVPADVVISTSSLRTTVFHMVGEAHFPDAYVERVRNLKGSMIAVQAKIALDRPLVSAGAIVGGVGEDCDLMRLRGDKIKEMYRDVAMGKVPEVVPFYCPVPTNFDPGLAPPGCQLLTACAVAPTSDIDLVDSAQAWEDAMMRALRKVVPGLDDHAMFIDRFSVKFIERWIGKQFGPAISTGQTPGQVGARRPTVHTPVRGLYLAGCGAGARGVGTELAAASAMECTDRILTDIGALVYRPAVRIPRRIRVARAAARPVAWITQPRAS